MQLIPIPRQLFDRAREHPQQSAYCVYSHNGWRHTSWSEYSDQVKQVAYALLALSLEPQQSVCILGYNRPEWILFDVACMVVGGVPAGIYTTSSPEEVGYIVRHSEAPVILVEDLLQWQKVNLIRETLPQLKHIILMEGALDGDSKDSALVFAAQSDPNTLIWEELLSLSEGVNDESLNARLTSIKGSDPATYIYTSGTTGPPKAVILTHDNLSWTARAAREMVGLSHNDRTLSYLPLSHIAEQMFSIHGPICTGATVYFSRSMNHLLEDLKGARPTVFFGVPRVWEKMHLGLTTQINGLSGYKARLVPLLRAVATEVNHLKNQGTSPPLSLRLRYAVAKQLFGKIKTALGLDQARVCVSGAAPIREEVLTFFSSLDLLIHEVYGQSEGCGPTTFNFPNATRFGTVGTRISGIEVVIAEDGEILLRGPNIFKGYLKDEEATRLTLDENGFLHSGDLGQFDREGFLKIVGRKKDIIITSGGKNIAPKNIEAAICEHEWVSQAVVIGDQKKYLSALITLNPESLPQRDAMGEAVPKEGLINFDHPEVYHQLFEHIEMINTRFAQVEQIKRFTILPDELSIEGGELTPTLKIKRAVITQKYIAEIDAMYEQA